MKQGIPRKAIVTFATLVAAGVIVSVTGARNLSGADQAILISLGSALVGGGLAFFLVEMFRWDRERTAGK